MRLSYFRPWLNGLGDYVACRQSGLKLQLSLVFFLLLVLFFLFFISWYVFPLFLLLALYLSFIRFCDKRISELLGMIRCNKN